MDILLIEMEILNIVNHLIQPGADGEAAPIRHIPEKNVKIGNPIPEARLKIAVTHGQFVKIAEHGHIQLFFCMHVKPSFQSGSGYRRLEDFLFWELSGSSGFRLVSRAFL